MTVILEEKAGLIVPLSVQRRAGIKPGDKVDFKVTGGTIQITAKRLAAVDDDEYTPAQREAITARLDKSAAQARKGMVSPAFETAEEMIRHLNVEVARRKKAGKAS